MLAIVNGQEDIVIGNSSMPTPSDINFYTPDEDGSLTPQDTQNPWNISRPDFEATSEPMTPSLAQPNRYEGSNARGQPLQPYADFQRHPVPISQSYQQHQLIQTALPQQPLGLPQYFAPTNANIYGNPVASSLPPTQVQPFDNRAPQGFTFQYSNCTGRRKAVLIGINYFRQKGQLQGSINDVKSMSLSLHECFGYQRNNMIILTDYQQNPESQPTKQNILQAMHWLVKDAQRNDSLFFHYSGHRGQIKDFDRNEDDGYDEAIYPVDFMQAGHIADDEMYRIMVKPLLQGVRLTAVFDSTHSGTAIDLPYIYSTQGILKEPALAKHAGQELHGVISHRSHGHHGGVASHLMAFFKKPTIRSDAYNRNIDVTTSPADVIIFSGSIPRVSADTTRFTKSIGAMSGAFIRAIKRNSQQNYFQLLNSIRDELETKVTQSPKLSSSHPLDMNLLYIM